MMGINFLPIYAANRFFNLNQISEQNSAIIFNGDSIYNFYSKGYARIFPISRNEFNLIDYATNTYWIVRKLDNKKIELVNEDLEGQKSETVNFDDIPTYLFK